MSKATRMADIAHPLRDRLAQRLSQSAAGSGDGHDANSRRRDPRCKRGIDRLPLEAEQDVASAPPCSRLEPSVERQDRSRLPRA